MVRDAARNPYAWPGGYPRYTVLQDGELLCPKCARENYREISWETRHGGSWAAAGVEVLWEGGYLDNVCAHCHIPLDSAYGNVEFPSEDR
jgi:hypothetical protein